MNERQARGLALAATHLKLARDFLDEFGAPLKSRERVRKALKSVQQASDAAKRERKAAQPA